MLEGSRATNQNLLIMRHITYILQNRIGGGKSLNSDFSTPKTATAITCGRTVLWMFFLLCAMFTTVSCSDGDAADDALSAIDTPPAAEAAPVYELLQGTWEVYAESTPELPIKHRTWDSTFCTFRGDSLTIYRYVTVFDFDGNRLPDAVTVTSRHLVNHTTADRISIDGAQADVAFGEGTARVTWQDWGIWLRNRKTTADE